MADIPKDTLEDACQLVKANSIQARGSAWIQMARQLVDRASCEARWAPAGAGAVLVLQLLTQHCVAECCCRCTYV